MTFSERLARASSLYGSGLIVLAACLLAYIASVFVAFAVAAVLQFAFGWSYEKTESAFWVLTVLCVPLPLGAFLARRTRASALDPAE